MCQNPIRKKIADTLRQWHNHCKYATNLVEISGHKACNQKARNYAKLELDEKGIDVPWPLNLEA
jgi:hypothetical protein